MIARCIPVLIASLGFLVNIKGVLSERLEQLGEVSQLCTYEDNNGTYEAEKAIDGDIYTFQHTCNNVDSWWRVDFGISASIEHVIVTDRANCQGGRLANSLVEVLDEENNVVSALSIVDSNPSVVDLQFNGVVGTAVRVTHGGGVSYEGDGAYLTMAEVEVHGTPLPTPMPTSTSSSMPTSTSSSPPLCSDSLLNVIQGGGVYGCHWIPDLASCERQGVKSHCPVTCNACDEYACLDSVRGFIYEGQEVRCASLARLSTADLEIYCSYPEVSSTCRGSCDVCATPTPTLLPTTTPTLLPTSTPTIDSVQYGDVMRVVNLADSSKGYLMIAGNNAGTDGFGVYTSQTSGLGTNYGDWVLMKILEDGSEGTGEVAHYGDIVRIVNQANSNKGYLMTNGNAGTGGFNVYTSPLSRLGSSVGDWKLVKILEDGSEGTDSGLVLVGDVMRFVNQYSPNQGYLMVSGNAGTGGFNVYTSPTSGISGNLGNWVFETF